MSTITKFDVFSIIIASATFVVVQSWNSLIKDTLDYYIPDKGKSITAKVLYTITITFLLALFVYYTTYYSEIIKNFIGKLTKFKK